MLTMQRLVIDFSAQSSAPSWRARLFLIASLVFLSISLAHYSDMTVRLDAARARVETLSGHMGKAQDISSAPMQRNAGEKQAQLEASINIDWDGMLAAIENATTDHVAITAIMADPRKHQVSITGQARTYSHTLDFVKKLSLEKPYSNAYLASHAVDEEDPDQPVDFVVEASWSIH